MAFRQALLDGDAPRCGQLWAGAFPNMPRPVDVLTAMHTARTAANSIPKAKRLFSHEWLTERGHESLLPDELKPMKPLVFDAVGVSVNTSSKRPERIEAANAFEYAISQAVGNAYASGVKDPTKIKEIMSRVSI